VKLIVFYGKFLIFKLNVGNIPYNTISPHNIAMGLNNVMFEDPTCSCLNIHFNYNIRLWLMQSTFSNCWFLSCQPKLHAYNMRKCHPRGPSFDYVGNERMVGHCSKFVYLVHVGKVDLPSAFMCSMRHAWWFSPLHACKATSFLVAYFIINLM
jgi:hypothetical protein